MSPTRPTQHHVLERSLGPFSVIALLCLGALYLGPQSAIGQLTVTDNLVLRQDDFDLNSLDEFGQFGSALVTCDFDDDGYEDLAIGAPSVPILGLILQAGAVYVAYGGPDGLTLVGSQTLTQPPAGPDPPEQNDQFGGSLAAGDFNGDGRCDLAAGAAFEDVLTALSAGSVHVFSGTDTGLTTTSQVWTQDSPGVLEVAETNENFGFRLAAGDFDADGFADLAIAVEENDAGAVHVLFGGPAGLTSIDDDLIFQGDSLGTLGIQEALDGFGNALAVGYFDDDPYADLAIGAPGEDSQGLSSIGWVHVFYPDGSRFDDRRQMLFDQSFLGQSVESGDVFGSRLAVGDFDGDGRDDLTVASTGEGVGGQPGGPEVRFAGSVAALYGTSTGLSAVGSQVWTQDSASVSDQAEFGDFFGNGLAGGDFNGDGFDDLSVGVPFEDFEGGGVIDTGATHAFYGSLAGLSPEVGEQFHGQSGWGVGANENGDLFGLVMTAGDFNGDGVSTLVVGVQLEDVSGVEDTGVVRLITGVSALLIFGDGFENGNTAAWSAVVP